MVKAPDFPFEEIVHAVEHLSLKGWECHQKFTCANCGQRLTIEEPNTLHTTGTCDKCGHLTDIVAQGCNYLAMGRNKSVNDLIDDQEEARKTWST